MTPRSLGRRFLLGSATDITAILVVIVALFAILDFGAFFTSANLVNVLINAALLIVMAVGATLVLITGGVDLSVGSVLVFSGVVAGRVMNAMGPQGWGASIAGIVVAM